MTPAWRSPAAVALLALLAAASVLLLPAAVAAVVVLTIVALAAVAARGDDHEPPREAAPVVSPPEGLGRAIAPLATGVLALDGDRNVLLANPAAASILARPLDSMIAVSLMQAVRDHDLAEVARQATGLPIEVHLSTANRDVLATATPVEFDAVRTLLAIEDVTELRRAQRARSELVANVSHELRTPIAAARALAETLETGVAEEDDRQRFLRRLLEEIDRLSAIVQRLLWLARVESGAGTFSPTPLDATDLLTESTERVAP
ncbi:MAG TPA: histidine kinase dimerization/phospho-acceptor domain-containing protein, partial [Dehalococcoidia bacterium]|nr:histidine kinase dimerization/phospho-acceptor domain-containing protein [Dehalococcoidia bacterium]